MIRQIGAACWAWMVLGSLIAMGAEPLKPLKPLNVPRDRAEWETRRGAIREAMTSTLDLGSRIERDDEATRTLFVQPPETKKGQRFPAILLLADEWPKESSAILTAPDLQARATELTRRGFAVMVHWTRPFTEVPWIERENRSPDEPTWAETLRHDEEALKRLLNQPSVDPKRVGVAGSGLAGMRACWLMALHEQVACAVAIGGNTRISDWQATQGNHPPALAPWARSLLKSYDTDAVIALCAPRHLQILNGDRDPLGPESGFKTLRDTARKVYGLYKDESRGIAYTLYGDLGAGITMLEWDSALETFDKEFIPQGPTPLGHAPESEPVVDSHFINPAEHGLAGWVSEMSQRPGTWTWRDGVITCQPGKNEYGWLRLPVEFEDFIFQVEWKVPPKGNSGIFLRAKPVTWFIPPSEKGKERVSGLGLTWPSRTGLELQAQDDPGIADKYSSGSLYRHAAPAENPIHPAGEWNRYTVRARGPRIEVWSNGKQILDANLAECETLRHTPLKGYIGLQDHGVPAEFRNIRYLRLEPDKKASNASASVPPQGAPLAIFSPQVDRS